MATWNCCFSAKCLSVRIVYPLACHYVVTLSVSVDRSKRGFFGGIHINDDELKKKFYYKTGVDVTQRGKTVKFDRSKRSLVNKASNWFFSFFLLLAFFPKKKSTKLAEMRSKLSIHFYILHISNMIQSSGYQPGNC